jgi:biopolymer transport protein ExbD
MKIRGYDKQNQEIKLAMTPMIDIVFQLLVFFIMTYQVTAMEGDYNIRMPSAAAEPTMDIQTLEDFLEVRLVANPDNRFLERIEVTFGPEQQAWQRSVYPVRTAGDRKLTAAEQEQNRQSRAAFNSLNQFVINIVGTGSGDPGSASEIEAEIEADPGLRYEDTVYAIEAISGYRDDTRKIIKLIEKIKFRDTTGG